MWFRGERGKEKGKKEFKKVGKGNFSVFTKK